MKKEITFVTGNSEKLAVAREALTPYGIVIEAKKIKCLEIQDEEIETIAKFSSKYASHELKCDVVKTDSGLFIEALNGFPGPYSAYVEEKIDASDILAMMSGKENRNAFYREVLAFSRYDEEPIVFESITRGTIAESMDGTHGWNFDRIFILERDTQTMANYEDQKRARLYNSDGWKKLAEYYINLLKV